MPQPVPDQLDQGLKPFVGSWSCEGKESLPGMPEFSYKSSVKNKWDLANFWMSIHYTRAKTKTTPAFEATAFWGYDNMMKKFIYVGLDSWGGHLHATSAGPQGNSISWDGEASAMGQGMPIKFSVTRDDKGHGLNFSMESNGQKIFEDTCK